MALIKLDPIVDKISGKVGGQSFVAGTNGNYIRNNAQTRKGTLNQGYQSKTKTPGVNATWQKLTNAEKQTFIDLVGTYPYTNRIDEVQQYSAYQIFMLCAQGTQLIDESIKFTASAFVVINKPLIEVFVNNSTSMTIEILNPQSGIYYAIYATSPQNVGVYSVRRNLRYLGFVTEAEAANIFDISAIYDAKFNAILPDRNYGIMVKPVVLNSGQIGPKSDISISPFLDIPTPPPSTNTFIYGIASIAPDETTLSALIGASVLSMSNFAIIGDDVFVTIDTPYTLPTGSFEFNTLITSYIDTGNLLSLNGNDCFANTPNLVKVASAFAGNIGIRAFFNSNIQILDTPNIFTVRILGLAGATQLNSVNFLNNLNLTFSRSFLDTLSLNIPAILNSLSLLSVRCFDNSAITSIESTSILTLDNTSLRNSKIVTADLPNCTSVGSFVFSNCTQIETINLTSCTNLGGTAGDNGVFNNIKLNCTITVPIALATNNGGNPDGDLQYAVASRNATIIYV